MHHVMGSGGWLAETAGRAVIYGSVSRVLRNLPLPLVIFAGCAVALGFWLYSRRQGAR